MKIRIVEKARTKDPHRAAKKGWETRRMGMRNEPASYGQISEHVVHPMEALQGSHSSAVRETMRDWADPDRQHNWDNATLSNEFQKEIESNGMRNVRMLNPDIIVADDRYGNTYSLDLAQNAGADTLEWNPITVGTLKDWDFDGWNYLAKDKQRRLNRKSEAEDGQIEKSRTLGAKDKKPRKRRGTGFTFSGKKIPSVSDAVYTEREKMPKWNVPVSPLMDADVAKRQLRRRLSDWSKEDHLEASEFHKEAGAQADKQWSEVRRQAHLKMFGKEPTFTDYKIAGIGLEEYPAETKNELRRLAELASSSRGAAHAHWKTAGKRSRLVFRSSAAPVENKAMPDGSFSIETPKDLSDAIRSVNRASNPAKAKSHIISRAKSLGLVDELPSNWVGKSLVLRGGKKTTLPDPTRDATFHTGKVLTPAQMRQRKDAANSPNRKRGTVENKTPENRTVLIGDLDDRDDLTLVTDSQDVEALQEHVSGADRYDGFLVKVGDGEYTEVYGFEGNIPIKQKRAFRLV